MANQITIWALGSPHGDDAVGWWIGRRLTECRELADCVRLAATPWDLLDHWPTDGSILIIDACHTGAPPGTIHFTTLAPGELVKWSCRSTHSATLCEVLQVAAALGYTWKSMLVYGIEMQSCAPGDELSESARLAAEEVVREVAGRAKAWPRC